jgi:hypothetical protein
LAVAFLSEELKKEGAKFLQRKIQYFHRIVFVYFIHKKRIDELIRFILGKGNIAKI